MKHRLFEEWLLSEEALSEAQQEALHEHLATCASCQALETAWHRIEAGFRKVKTTEPRPGFVKRWEARWAARRAQEEKRTAWLILSVNALIAIALLGVLLGLLVAELPSPTALLLGWIESFTSVYAFVELSVHVLGTLLRTLANVVPARTWLNVGLSLVAVFLLWISTLRRFAHLRGVQR